MVFLPLLSYGMTWSLCRSQPLGCRILVFVLSRASHFRLFWLWDLRLKSLKGQIWNLTDQRKPKWYFVWHLPNSRTNIMIKVVLDKPTNDARFPNPSILKIKESMTVSQWSHIHETPDINTSLDLFSRINIWLFVLVLWQAGHVTHFRRKVRTWLILFKHQHCEWISLALFPGLPSLQALCFIGWILYSCCKYCCPSSRAIYLYKQTLCFPTHGALHDTARETISFRPVAQPAQASFQNRLITPTFQHPDSTELVKTTFPWQDKLAHPMETLQSLWVVLKR